MAEPHTQEEHFDVLTKTGEKTGFSKPRGDVHRDGDYHRAVHMWIFAESTQELLLQLRADCKDSWPGLWDISSAGHISAGDSSLETARRELQEELGVILPNDAFELIFIFLHETITNGGQFINNEFEDVYLVTTLDPIPLEAFTLQMIEADFFSWVCSHVVTSSTIVAPPLKVIETAAAIIATTNNCRRPSPIARSEFLCSLIALRGYCGFKILRDC